MGGTSVREAVGGGDISPLPDLSGLSRSERIRVLRSQISALGAVVPHPDRHPAGMASPEPLKQDILAVPEMFSDYFPGGGLPRRAVTSSQNQPLLVVELLAHVTARGGYAAVIGWKDFAYAGVVESAGACENIIVVPDPGTEPLNIVAVLCEGLDLVVYRGPEITLSPARARPLLGKLRKGTAALMLVGTHMQSPAVTVEADITDYLGIGPGHGRIRGVEMKLQVTAKGHAPVSGNVVFWGAKKEAVQQDKGQKSTLRAV